MNRMFPKISFLNKGQSLIGIIVMLVVVGLVVGGMYYYFSRQTPKVPEAPKVPEELIVEPEPEPEPETEPELEPAVEISKEEALTECRAMPAGYDKEECFLYSAFWFRDKSFCDEVVIDLNQCICYAAMDVFLRKSKIEQEQILKEDPLNNEEIKKAITEQCPETIEVGVASRNATRIAHLSQIRMAQEMYWGEEGQYYQSTNYPVSISYFMSVMPTDPLTEGPYGWIDNTKDPQKFCVYANLEKKGFYVVGPAGGREIAIEPHTLADCEKF